MTQRTLLSEGESLDSFLRELEGVSEIKEIAGWESGYPGLSRALNGLFPGLYLLVGPPSSGKTAFAKQLCDQVALHNCVPAIFFTFSESREELRVRTLARLSGLESREIQRGSAFFLHRYGVPKSRGQDVEQLPPSWEKLRRSAEEARGWLDLLYLFECGAKSDLNEIGETVQGLKEARRADRVMAVIDDSQRLGAREQSVDQRLPFVAERLKAMAFDLRLTLFAVWPEFEKKGRSPQEWGERAAGADVILVLEEDLERTKSLTPPNRAVALHIVKNRGGEKGRLAFDFYPGLSKFSEADQGPPL